MKLPRPKSILWFERFYFLSLGIELLDEYVKRQSQLTFLEDFGLDEVSAGLDTLSYLVFWVLVLGISFVIWYFLAIKAKSWARWAQIILAGLGVITLFLEIGGILVPIFEDAGLLNVVWKNMEWPEDLTGLYVTFVIVNAVATYFLFRRDAIKWVEEKQVSIDTVFD